MLREELLQIILPEDHAVARIPVDEPNIRGGLAHVRAGYPQPILGILHLQLPRDGTGILYASEQINDLLARGVDGIHLYTMNHPCVTRRIWANVQDLFA